jgi:S1-C subfamily serine protease
MDLEKLTKHQILLLTLLVSFVTSIATGIVTVSLMDQAPEGVTRVINQIVERTVETVVPSTQGAAVATETIVVKQDELVPQSIAAAQKSVVRIVAKDSSALIARGVIVDANGTVWTDAGALAASQASLFEAILPTGERVPALPQGDLGASTIARVSLTLGTSTVQPAKFVDRTTLTLGQTVLRIGGAGADTVGEGVIAALPTDANVDVIYASVSSATPGSIIITIFGEVIGMSTAGLNASDAGSYLLLASPAAPVVTNTTPNT